MEAPIPKGFDKNIILENMKKICENILLNILEGKEYKNEKVKIWGETIITEIKVSLAKKYPEFGYEIFFYISKKTAYVSHGKCIYFSNTDNAFIVSYHNEHLYSEIRIFANKLSRNENLFLENIEEDSILKINETISSSLENKIFVFEEFKKVVDNLTQSINLILLKRNKKPCSYHVCYINKLPIKNLYFTYKFFNLEYKPLFFSYSNDSLSCRCYLFIVNN